MKRSKKGFTLIELIVVIAIIGILAAILIPQFTGFQAKAKATQALVDAKQVATAFDGLFIEQGSYATITEAQVETLSGVAATTFVLETDGGLVVTVVGGYKAGRTAGGQPVKMDPS